MIKKEIKNLEDGEKVTIIAYSHGGNVVKYASQGLNQGELDRVIFLATPHRGDASFNQASLNKGGKVVNVYDERDLVQGFLGKFDKENWNPLAPNPKQTMSSAINIKVKQPNGASSMLGTKDETSPHSIHTTRKWNDFVKTKLEDK